MREMRRLLQKAVVLWLLGVALVITSVAATVATADNGPKPPASTRFVDNGDGTITDTRTGLMWEKKTGTVDLTQPIGCGTPTDCADPTNVNNLYTWSVSQIDADGTLFTDFLVKMNCTVLQQGGRCGPGVYHDWRIPTIAELQSIAIVPCSSSPCIDPIFGATAASFYWSASSDIPIVAEAWIVTFISGNTDKFDKTHAAYVRAVRGGR